MRFYIGFSKRIKIKTILEIISFLFIGLLSFFGIYKTAFALEVSFSPNGYDVHAYRPLYANTDQSCSAPNGQNPNYYTCGSATNLYNATGCNPYTSSSGDLYCMFQNANSTNYFQNVGYLTRDNVNYMEQGSYTNDYRPHSKLVWRWRNSVFANTCSSGTITLKYTILYRYANNLFGSNVFATGSKLCADNLNSLTGSIGTCSTFVSVNGNNYSGTLYSYGNVTGNYQVTIPIPTTDLEITIPQIQPFLPMFIRDGNPTLTYSSHNFGAKLNSYECNQSSTNLDTNSITQSIDSNTQTIINNQQNNTDSINDNLQGIGEQIQDSVSDIVDSISQNQDDNTQQIIDEIQDQIDSINDNIDSNTSNIIDSQKVCSYYDVKYIAGQSQSSLGWQYNKVLQYNSFNDLWTVQTKNGWSITDMIPVSDSYKYVLSLGNASTTNNLGFCFYNSSNTLIECRKINDTTLGSTYSVPVGSSYVRFSIKSDDYIYFQVKNCKNGNQAIYDSITDDSVSPGGFGINFPTYPTEIQTLMGMPINLISTVINYANNGTCTALSFDLSSITQRWGGTNYVLQVPCMKPKLQSLLGDYYGLFDIIMAALLFYFVACNIVGLVHKYISMEDLFPHYFETSRSSSFVKEEVYKE